MKTFISLLRLGLLTVFINTSLTADINENLLRNVLQSNGQLSQYPNVEHSNQIDLRLSDVIAKNVLHFGHRMGLELAALDPNIMRSAEIFSPLSLVAALAQLTLGARGRSYQELKQILGLDSDSELINDPNKYHHEFGLMLHDLQHKNVNSDGINKRLNAIWRSTKLREGPVRHSNRPKPPVEHIIKIANGLFVQTGYTLNPDYSQVVQSIYGTEFTPLNFQARNGEARNYINNWVNKATFGKIPNIIQDEIDETTNVILASALYFKAFWETTFFVEGTAEENFFPDGINNPPIKAQMMPTGGIFPFYDAKEYDCRIIGLPYKGNETTMYVIQPNDSSRQKLRDLQNFLDAHKINRMIDNMQRKTTIMLFPKMHFSRSMQLKKSLQTMNVRDIFHNDYSDLSLIGQRPKAGGNASPPPFTAQQTAAQNDRVTFEMIYRKNPALQFPDRLKDSAVVFPSRLGEINDSSNSTEPIRQFGNTTPMGYKNGDPVTTNAPQTNKRKRRQSVNSSPDRTSLALSNLESFRHKLELLSKSDLYVDDIVHNVDFSVDESGTEAAAATLTVLHRSGTDVVFRGDTPFLIIIRHDPTKLPLFYGIINKPEL